MICRGWSTWRCRPTPSGRWCRCSAPLASSDRARLIVEKPFGHDLASARALNQTLHAALDESQVFRIDHFLGKEAVQNILAFRFANGLFEPVGTAGTSTMSRSTCPSS